MTDTGSPLAGVHPTPGSRSVERVALFAATRWEYAAVRAAFASGREQVFGGVRTFVSGVGEREYWLVRTGIGPEKARRVAEQVLSRQAWAAAVSTGFACALTSAKVGDLIVGLDVIEDVNGRMQTVKIDRADAARKRLQAVTSGVPVGVQTGAVLSINRIACRASEKAHWAHVSGAVGLDMESAALAREAQKARVPFLVARTVSDLADEDLPLDFNLFLRPGGWLVGAASVLAAPSRLAGLARLRRQSRLAAANLTQVVQAYAGSGTSARSEVSV